MNDFKKSIALSTVFIFLFSFSIFPSGANAAQVSDGAQLLPMKGNLAPAPDPTLSESMGVQNDQSGLADHQATVFETSGDVRILKEGEEEWTKAEKDMKIEEGDQIVTGTGSHLDIAYDKFFLNIARIQEKTKGEFRSIEPTDLFLEDGTIFSALDGLGGNKYQISTPTAVAGVRGTTFDVQYEAQTGHIKADVFPDESAKVGEIVLERQDGEEVKLVEGQAIFNGEVGEIPADRMTVMNQFVAHVADQFGTQRQEGFVMIDQGFAPGRAAEPMEDRLDGDDNKKIGGGPGNGGDTGGGNGPQMPNTMNGPGLQSTLGSTQVDALMDQALEPPAMVGYFPSGTAATGMNPAGGDAMNTPDPNRYTAGNGMQYSAAGTYAAGMPAGSAVMPAYPAAPDPGRAMEFLVMGGAMTNGNTATSMPGAPASAGFNYTSIFTSMGFNPDQSQQMGNYAAASFTPYMPAVPGPMGGAAMPGGMYTAPIAGDAGANMYGSTGTTTAPMYGGAGAPASMYAPATGGMAGMYGDPGSAGMMSGMYTTPGGAGMNMPGAPGTFDPMMGGAGTGAGMYGGPAAGGYQPPPFDPNMFMPGAGAGAAPGSYVPGVPPPDPYTYLPPPPPPPTGDCHMYGTCPPNGGSGGG